MRRLLSILVVFGVLLFGIVNTSSALTITDLPMVNVGWNASIDLGNCDLMGPLLNFIDDRLDLYSPFEPMAKRPKKPKKPKKPNPTATPEPATWLLIGSGAAGIALIRKRFKK